MVKQSCDPFYNIVLIIDSALTTLQVRLGSVVRLVSLV